MKRTLNDLDLEGFLHLQGIVASRELLRCTGKIPFKNENLAEYVELALNHYKDAAIPWKTRLNKVKVQLNPIDERSEVEMTEASPIDERKEVDMTEADLKKIVLMNMTIVLLTLEQASLQRILSR